jgi:hypothetical protein
MSNQRSEIEILRDCLRILRDAQSADLSGEQYIALEKYARDTIDSILRPFYSRPSVSGASEPER